MLVVGGRYQDTPPERLPWAKTEDGKVSVKVRDTRIHFEDQALHAIGQHRLVHVDTRPAWVESRD